ncbi:MAG: uL15 family ribosomal protein [Candidatus Zambryskibacteria bacterium]|nr:uL15 family ribosomal protein [Candidatus Zambryskibacteria bacterium]
MQMHNLRRIHSNKKTRQIGRGGTRGKTSGRGTKGQNARAGHKKRPEIRDFIKRIPKLRGRGKNINTSIKRKPTVFNLGDLNTMFKSGDIVSPKTLSVYGKVKILGGGALDKKLTIENCLISKSARLAVEKADGTIY